MQTLPGLLAVKRGGSFCESAAIVGTHVAREGTPGNLVDATAKPLHAQDISYYPSRMIGTSFFQEIEQKNYVAEPELLNPTPTGGSKSNYHTCSRSASAE